MSIFSRPEPEASPEAPFDPFAALAAEGIKPPEPIEIVAVEDSHPVVSGGPVANDFQISILVNDQVVPKKGINPKDLIGATKIDLSVVPPSAELHLATAMMDGAKKYGAFNWRENPVLARVYVAAARRHLLQYLDGENFDPISGVHHLGHAMACLAIIIDATETGNLADDRPVPGKAGDMIRRFTPENKLG